MARVVEVGLNVDAGGAIKAVESTGASFRDLAESAEVAGTETDEALGKAASAARSSSASVGQASQNMRKLSNESKNVASSGAQATQILFSAGDAVQDVQFGFQGAANNIAFMAEQFTDLRSRTGSNQAALQALVTSLTGAGGLILAFQALLAIAPQIISFFADTEEGAKDAEDSLQSLANSLIEVSDIEVSVEELDPARAQELIRTLDRELRQLRGTEDDISTAVSEDVEGVLSQMERLVTALETIETAEQGIPVSGASLQNARATIDLLAEALSLENATADEAQRALDTQRQRARVLDATVSALRGATTEREQQQQIIQLLRSAGAEVKDITEDEADAAERISRARDVQAIRLKGFSERLQEARQRAERVRDLLQELNREEPRTVSEIVSEVDVRPPEPASDAATEQERLNEELQRTADLVSQSLVTGFSELGRAIGEGQSALAAFGRAAASILSSISRAIGQELIAQGTALVASALLPGQQGNAAAGAAYIAAGGALIASSSALSSLGGGGGTGRGAAPSATASGGRQSFGQEGRFGGGVFNQGVQSATRTPGRTQQSRIGVDTTVTANITVDDPMKLENITTETSKFSSDYLGT